MTRLVPDTNRDLAEIVDEITDRLNRGESIDLSQYAPDDSQLRLALEQIVDTLSLLHEPAAGAASATEPPPAAGQLGDFRLIRELGRGGMGVVYEAEQISLGRRVALKVLPFAAMLDKQQLNRFKNEARAAATLDHPNIVSIYSVGAERGVHYYAMQLIEGCSLAEIIAAMKPGRSLPVEETAPTVALPHAPVVADTAKAALSTVDDRGSAAFSSLPAFESREYFRAVAKLGIQAAEALDHAHQNGILHRDIKPANLLVECTHLAPRDAIHLAERDDHFLKLWITDFGLARIEQDAGLTMTGDILGTLRYMSPEQAAGKRLPLDHRTDVYSLGITLYELLSGRPAFETAERAPLLHAIAETEPPALRKLVPTIPIDLETIVRKAIEKDAADRYATSQHFADDLRRFIEQQPIKARPATLLQRTVKWSRRHTAVVWSALLASIVLAIVSVASVTIISTAWQKAKRSEETARNELLAARRNLYRANVQVASNEWAEGRVPAVDHLLDQFLPQPGQPDLRGWEWYYLKSLPHNEKKSFSGRLISGTSVSTPVLLTYQNGESYSIRQLESSSILLSTSAVHERRRFVASPDGRQLACISRPWDKTPTGWSVIEIWDVTSRARLVEIRFDCYVPDVAWSPDGQRIVICQSNEEATIWNARDGKESGSLKGLQGMGVHWCAEWSPDGNYIAIGGNVPGEIAICRSKSGALVRRFKAHDSMVTCLAFSPDMRRVATCSSDQSIGIWFVETGLLDRRLIQHSAPVNAVSWSRDGSRLASGSEDGVIKIADTSTWDVTNTLIGHRDTVSRLMWTDARETLASSSSDGTRLWNVNQEQRFTPVSALAAHTWLPSGRQLITWRPGADRNHIERFDVNTKVLDEALPLSEKRGDAGSNISAMDVNRTGELLAIAEKPGEIEVWSLLTKQRTLKINAHPGEIRSVAWNPAGTILASGSLGDSFKIWNAKTGDKIAQLDAGLDGFPGSMAWSPDGTRLATIAWWGEIRIWDANTWQTVYRLPHEVGNEWAPDGQRGLAWSPMGDRLAGRLGGWVLVWDTKTGRERLVFRAHVANVRCVAWSPDGSRLATGSEDHTIKIWNADSGEDMLTLRANDTKTILSLSWSPDGKILASGGPSLKLWDATSAYEKVR